jgi:hypothetical protein
VIRHDGEKEKNGLGGVGNEKEGRERKIGWCCRKKERKSREGKTVRRREENGIGM